MLLGKASSEVCLREHVGLDDLSFFFVQENRSFIFIYSRPVIKSDIRTSTIIHYLFVLSKLSNYYNTCLGNPAIVKCVSVKHTQN